MSLSFRSTVVRAGLAAVVAALAAGGAVAGVTAASASPWSHPAAAVGFVSGQESTAPAIDHQLCYTAAAKGFKIPASVTLENQFSSAAFPVKIGSVALHCNPVEKILPTGKVFPINFPNDHLLCWQITEPAQPAPKVVATN
ncbi:MAG: hypothetical protein ACRDNF_21005, partial [Streptosporangiaceae bacterium]